MAIICKDYNLLFIMNPRTGCTALGGLLKSNYNGSYIPSSDITDKSGKVVVQSKHTTIPQIREYNLMGDEELKKFKKFTSVRNPFDSLVSLWTKKKYKYSKELNDPNSIVHRLPGYKKDMEFIQNNNFSDWIVEFFSKRKNPTINAKHVSGVDRWLRFENLQADFDELLWSLGIDNESKISKANVTDNRASEYRDYYDSKARRVVEDKFAIELMIFGYEF